MKRILLVIFLSLCFMGCSKSCPNPDAHGHENNTKKIAKTEKAKARNLKRWVNSCPEGAYDIKPIGSYWCEFTYNEKRFLAYQCLHNFGVTELSK